MSKKLGHGCVAAAAVAGCLLITRPLISDELDVAAVLRGDTEPETAEDTDDLVAG